jgi:D-alanyl-lipoteichoic acid acyltransferase DltB (MBOAT superfamily)
LRSFRGGAVLAGALLLFIIIDLAAFYAPLYRPLLDPKSSTGAFEGSLAALRALPPAAQRDVLVLGDSRIYSGLDPAWADRASRGMLRFLNGGVPGTNPRCWYFFLQELDPHATRYRALVIPVDTYSDDDSALGSIDGDQRTPDLHYIALAVPPSDVPKLARSFPDPRTRLAVAIDMLLRGPELRGDVQALLASPRARLQAIADAKSRHLYDPFASHLEVASVSGTHLDARTGRLTIASNVPAGERPLLADIVLRLGRPSPSYAEYRRRWLEPIVRRYAAAGVPVIFVRIPTRPIHRDEGERVDGTIAGFERRYGATLLAAAPYGRLEQPQLFFDHDHLDRSGGRTFSLMLGRDVARVLSAPHSGASIAGVQPATTHTAERPRTGLLVGIGIPMPMQSYEFWIFILVVAAGFYCLPVRVRWWFLLGASYYFYARWNGAYVGFLWALTLSDWAIGLGLERLSGNVRRIALAAGIAANVAFLGTFKYANFAGSTIAALAGMHGNPWFVKLFVPIGISFHTFQSISYLVDVYRGKIPATRSLSRYAMYLAFFPQLLAGPIVRAGLFFSELLHWHAPDASEVSYGCMRAAFGLAKKIGIADQFSPISDAYFSAPAAHPGALAAAGAIFAFSMQIYFDFSGYSDIAIGCARLFGFIFPENFAQPYLASSVTDFWHRWHITLSTWLRDYLYIPLGGNRGGEFATLRNLLLTMLLGGLWHGAQWTFVAWGAVHGVLLCIERIAGVGRAGDAPRGIAYISRAAATFAVVSLAWVLFRAPDFTTAGTVYRQFFTGGLAGWPLHGWIALLAAGIVCFAMLRAGWERVRTFQWNAVPPALRAGALATALLCIELLSWPGTPATFIYFKF